jgi:hypothetical protein
MSAISGAASLAYGIPLVIIWVAVVFRPARVAHRKVSKSTPDVWGKRA